ncbi:MAG: DNA topoisomerase IV subunit A [Gemmataceae bacterium]|nr:DNA topoisomerase IV subunit A [Gemmataceae bacterium]
METIVPASLHSETRERYLIYAMSVITSRALPDVRDGLKPVQRRLLYTMYNDLRLTFDGRPRKCAKIVGDVTGNYHPHGTSAAYEALVRLAQDWVLREPLVQGQGNFGSVDGDPPAAERYTEAKLSAIAERLMDELRQRTVDMRPNYDNTREEPIVLPAQFPNLLVNGSSGIAVGLATNIPPHNLGDTVRAAMMLIDNPEATTAMLLERLKGPDFPLGGRILADRAEIRKIYEEGSGSIRVQGEWKFEDSGKKPQIVITSIPYGVDKGKLESDIGAIIEDRKLPSLLNVVNESNEKDGLRIALEIKPGTDPDLVMAYLFRHTSLQDTFSFNMTCLIPVPGEALKTRPERLGLKPILRHFLDFRLVTVRRRFEYELEILRRRIHILEGFAIIFDALDQAIRLIRNSQGKSDAAEKLIKAFKLDQIQADAILEAAIYRIAQMEILKIREELAEKQKEAARIERILSSEKRLWGVVRDELEALAEAHPDRRRTRIASAEDAPEFDPEAYIARENAQVVLTRDGWVKRVGRMSSIESTRVREGDEVIALAPGSTLDPVVFVSEDGTAYTQRIHDIPASTGYGEPIVKFFKIADQTRLISALTTDPRFIGHHTEKDGPWLLVATSAGMVVRTAFEPFCALSTKAGRKCVRLGAGEKVVFASLVRGGNTLFLATAKGRMIHFPTDEIPVLSGAGKGVIGIRLDKGDEVLGGMVPGNSREL